MWNDIKLKTIKKDPKNGSPLTISTDDRKSLSLEVGSDTPLQTIHFSSAKIFHLFVMNVTPFVMNVTQSIISSKFTRSTGTKETTSLYHRIWKKLSMKILLLKLLHF